MDAIKLLKDDHRTVKKLFRRYEGLGDRALQAKQEVVDQIIRELSIHAAIEEQIFYPAARQTAEGTTGTVLESLEEHGVVKTLLAGLSRLTPADERFDAKVTVVIELVRHHIEEEEDEFFPKVRKAIGARRLREIGEAMEKAKALAPTRPHPRAPDQPPGNVIVGAVSGFADRAFDAGRGVVERTVKAVRGRGGASAAPAAPARKAAKKGPAATKRTAKKAAAPTKRPVKKAAATTKRTAKKAAATTKRTAKKAFSPAKRPAKKAAAATKRTAKKAAGTATRTAKKATKKAAPRKR